MKTKFNRRSILAASAAAALAPGAALFPGQAGAQAWPNKPIRWVVPYTAGGLTDSVTRLTLEKTNVGQTFVVDNKPGANSLIGAEVGRQCPARWLHLPDRHCRRMRPTRRSMRAS